jgi:heterodisulfide reductase subunit A
VRKAADGFVHTPHPVLSPCRTDGEGVFVAGNAAGPKDIPDSIVQAGDAATEAANYLRRGALASAEVPHPVGRQA